MWVPELSTRRLLSFQVSTERAYVYPLFFPVLNNSYADIFSLPTAMRLEDVADVRDVILRRRANLTLQAAAMGSRNGAATPRGLAACLQHGVSGMT